MGSALRFAHDYWVVRVSLRRIVLRCSLQLALCITSTGLRSILTVYDSIARSSVHEGDSPVILMKACKNEAELAGMKAAHIRDGASMAEFYAWLESELPKRKYYVKIDLIKFNCTVIVKI